MTSSGLNEFGRGGIYVANERNKVVTTIYGREYTIVGVETTDHLRKVAREVDEKMQEIGSQNHALDSGRLAVLTAVNATHDYLKLEQKYLELEQELARIKGRD
ncbi:cell division protein ZapA [Listeria monocytogenes]|nr:cell division protein ZapA [Listeria monocytogenes]ASG93883.1 cell division protein ZapA [Listeria monocytogenes serotype 4b str. 02-6679]ASH75650.1 cell division protein ZapA [Listeria monocytogenes serotype 4b str. 02-6680]KXS71858.1 cell division protein ZapA [Listeria monocytogenes]KXS76410.1 cell division protein ZapA [Listeria monocytogenes]KXX01831.1 cell division protein ZapA [Listeria monocytogenes]